MLFIYGAVIVIYTSACLKDSGTFFRKLTASDMEDRTSFIWIGICLAIAPVAPALGYALGGNYKLFTGKKSLVSRYKLFQGKAAELILVVAFLFCERERGKIMVC